MKRNSDWAGSGNLDRMTKIGVLKLVRLLMYLLWTCSLGETCMLVIYVDQNKTLVKIKHKTLYSMIRTMKMMRRYIL